MFPTAGTLPLTQSGALDDLDTEAIAQLEPRPGEHVLVTRLRDGREVTIAKERVLQHMQDAVSRLEASGADVICVLCTGEFALLESEAVLIYPDRILTNVVDAILPQGTIGVLMPHPLQHDSMVDKWSTATRSVVTASVSPYSADAAVSDAVSELEEQGAALIVMDCMGFDREMQVRARAAVRVPVILANGLTGAVISEVITGLDVRLDESKLVQAADGGRGRQIGQA